MSRNDLFLLLACAAVAAMMAGNGDRPASGSHLALATLLPSFAHDERPQGGGWVESTSAQHAQDGNLR